MKPLRIFIGYDIKENVAFHVLSHSILRRASVPVSITPIVRSQLGSIFTRERGPLESTDFAISRFLVPYLSDYEGISIFMDCDMLCLADVRELWALARGPVDTAVWVVQHDYTPKAGLKMDGQQQTAYPRKNWSSLIVFDNAECGALTPEYVNTATALDLHRFVWTGDERIGSLPLEWNWLVAEDNQAQVPPRIIHYTNGGPWFDGFRACDHSEEWLAERASMLEPRAVGVQPPWKLPRRSPWPPGVESA